MARVSRNSTWFWVILVVAIAVGYSAIIAVTTHDSACSRPDSPKHWVIFPPGWECERRF